MSEERDVGGEPEPWETSFDGKTVVIGLGNGYMRDDGVGLVVARQVRERHLAGIAVYEYSSLDLSLLWEFRRASKIVIVDALRSGLPPGTVQRYAIAPKRGPLTELPSLHTLQLYDIFDLAVQSGIEVSPVVIVGVEPRSCDPGEGLTAEVASAVPGVLGAVLEEARSA